MEAEWKKFYKKLISYCIFFKNKKCFPLLTCKVFLYLIKTHAISSQRSQILRRTDTSCLCNIGTCSKPCDVSWLFWVYLCQTIQYKLFQELRIHLSADSYLWSVHLVVNIVKAMFKSIFFRLIFTPCCKYTYNKNNVKFSKPTSSELRQELLKLNSLKVVHKSRSLSNPFPANHCSAFSYSHSFSCALYSDDSSWQTSDKKLRKY